MELGTGMATVADESTGLAVLSPTAGVSVGGDGVTAGVVVGALGTPDSDGGLAEEAPGTTGTTEEAMEVCEFSASAGFDEASGEFEGAAVGEEGSFVGATSVKP
jgi:hypothetical protein